MCCNRLINARNNFGIVGGIKGEEGVMYAGERVGFPL